MNRQDPTVKKHYSRVENRKDYKPPKDTEATLDILESTGELDSILSPSFVHERLLKYYIRYAESDITPEEKKEIINKAWNLSRPTLHQVIRKFRRSIDVYPHIRSDVLSDCSLVVTRVFVERKYDMGRGTRITSYLFEFFIYAVLGILSKHFKEKKKYVCVDPQIMSKMFSGDANGADNEE